MHGAIRLGQALVQLLDGAWPRRASPPPAQPGNMPAPVANGKGPPAAAPERVQPSILDRLASLPRSRQPSPPVIELIDRQPKTLAPAGPQPTGKSLAPGVWYGVSGRTRDGAPVRVVTVDPRQARLGAVFDDGVASVSAASVRRQPGLVAAINGTFFGAGVVGDLRGSGRTYLDENAAIGNRARAADQASDQRYYVAVTRSGEVLTGKGGLPETGRSAEIDAFQGGMGLLFTRAQADSLEADIRSGAFAARNFFGPAAQRETAARSFMGVQADGKVLLVTMGEGRNRSQGANFTEAARLLRSMGAVEAFFLDGGGSTSLIVPGVEETRTDGRQVKNYLGVYARPVKTGTKAR